MITEKRCFTDSLQHAYQFTFQEKRILSEIEQDFEMWQERPLAELWNEWAAALPNTGQKPQIKNKLIRQARLYHDALRSRPAVYGPPELSKRPSPTLRPVLLSSAKKIYGPCPVASEETVCCNLQTLDAVQNCAYGCSYCTIQTFYDNQTLFDADLEEKLDALTFNPDRIYHLGTGQSSDSLVWGNRYGVLDHLLKFAQKNPNVILELKTKSAHIQYFLEHAVPSNILLTWSLNPQTVIDHEEHFTASLEERLRAASQAAEAGILTGFHFHPMIHYEGWENDYTRLSQRVQQLFHPDQIALISFGSLTFIKPVIREIRKRGTLSQVLRMKMTSAGKGKLSYPEPLKTKMFSLMRDAFKAWEGQVFMYLCMENKAIWEQVFGKAYDSNSSFEEALNSAVMHKISSR